MPGLNYLAKFHVCISMYERPSLGIQGDLFCTPRTPIDRSSNPLLTGHDACLQPAHTIPSWKLAVQVTESAVYAGRTVLGGS